MGCGVSSSGDSNIDSFEKDYFTVDNNNQQITITVSHSGAEDQEIIRGPIRIKDSAKDRRLTGEETPEVLRPIDRESYEEKYENREQLPLDREGKYFSDEYEFPVSRALSYIRHPNVVWMRPHETAEKPSLYVNGTSRNDVIQGSLGDCWLLSTAATLAKRGDLIYKVVPKNQSLDPKESKYTGAIRVRLWRFGKWRQIFIDDRLPSLDGQYIYGRSLDPNEFWVAMVEKAFAKSYGTYEAIEGGMPLEAMIDLTGGIAERYALLKDNAKQIHKYLRRSFAHQAFVTCSRQGKWQASFVTDANGLIRGHAYTVTGIYAVDYKGSRVHLVRIRNPWGDENEWKGDWSDSDKKWDHISYETKKSIGLHRRHDGEFWMDFYEDFHKEFMDVTICTLGPDLDEDGNVETLAKTKTVYGEWTKGISAGGSRNDLDCFSTNPQYLLQIYDPDNLDDDDEDECDSCQVIIGLSQDYHRSSTTKLSQIAFCLYKANSDEPGKKLSRSHFSFNYDVGTSGTYINYRDVFKRFELCPGYYVLIPATYHPDDEKKFMIRVFAGKDFEIRKID